MRSASARSLVLAALLAAVVAAPARAERGLSDLIEDAHAAVSNGLALLRLSWHQAPTEAIVSHAIAVSSREASLELETAGGTRRTFALRGGRLFVDGREAGAYAAGGGLDRAWRRLLADATQLDTRALVVALRAWQASGLAGEDLTGKRQLDAAFRSLGAEATLKPVMGADSLAVGLEESLKGVDEVLAGAESAAAADEAALAVADAAPQASALDRVFHDVGNVVAMFIAFAMLGFGTVFFGRRYLEVVADTATHSFGRSIVVGLLGQLLLLPTFAMLVVGLVFTIVGILLLPFAVLAYVIGFCLAALGGFLAVAHAVGETFTRRRMAHGAFVRAPNAYGYVFTGLIGLLGLWALAALTGWMGPVVILFRVLAVIVTWLAATAGFGAVLLSRGGLRETFAGRHIGELSDEYLWATPPATPTAGRMEQK